MSKHKFYRQKNDIDYQEIYDSLEPDDQSKIDEWVKQFTAVADANSGAAAPEKVSYIKHLGEKGAFELVMKTVIFVARRTR